MAQTLFKKLLPHIIAIAIFLIVALIFCKPALETDVVMKQGDITNWQGMSHQSFQYKEKHGRFPLWSVSMYSGMPGYQFAMDGPWTPLVIVDRILQLGLPKPVNIFFLASICFYFLCICLKVRPWVAVIGGIGFAYCSTFPIFITAGHDTQMLALAYAPAVLAGILLLFDKKYISGFIVTALFTGLQIAQGHQQVSYYVFLVAVIMIVYLLLYSVRQSKLMPQLKAVGLATLAGIIGVMINAVTLLTVYDYSKESKRGGQLVMEQKQNSQDVINNNKTKGLSKDYAFMWSNGWSESMSLLFPGVSGYGAHYAERDGDQSLFPKLDENSNAAKYLTGKLNVPEDQAANIASQLSTSLYWGDQPFTVGPIYLGAVICLLFLFAMVYLEGPHKWWILTCAILGILLALGKHFAAFNYFLFDHFPFYNKFRVPTMALEITQLVVPIGAVLGLEKLINDPAVSLKKIRLALIVSVAVFLLAALLYFTMDYSNENKKRTAVVTQIMTSNNPNLMAAMDSVNRMYPTQSDNQLYENFLYQTKGDAATARGILTALRQDRQAAFGSTILRSLLFVLIAIGIMFLYHKKNIKVPVMLAGIGLLTVIDLLTFSSNYLNKFSFESKDNYEASAFPLTPADQAILKDTDPNFRVYNTTAGDPFQGDSRTSYYHKSIGGYHPARLGIYDDLMTYQLNSSPNPAIINMLNVKYFIVQNQQTKGVDAMPNPGALGNCWFIKNVQYVHGPVAEMKALNNFNPSETAIVDDVFKSQLNSVTSITIDSAGYIKQGSFDNEAIQYESSSSSPQIAVFSEIYYKDWKAYIDGKAAPIAKANYVLRAMLIPAGKHNIEFKFEPGIYYTDSTITSIGAWILTLLMIGYIIWLVLPLVKNKTTVEPTK